MLPKKSKRGAADLDDADGELGSHSPPTTRTSKRRRMANGVAREESSTTRNAGTRGSGSSRRTPSHMTPESGYTRVVTPSRLAKARESTMSTPDNGGRTVRRALLQSPGREPKKQEETQQVFKESPKAKRRLAFGRVIIETPCQKNVQNIYRIISKLTGSVGGNGSFGAIYGELTVGSMQKMIDLMKIHTGFSSASRFIDVGSGLGKPSLHVCQDPGVEFSYGIEMEMSRWMLGMANLQAIIKAAKVEEASGEVLAESDKIGTNCFFDHGNIMDAISFDPFTHIYMFSIGFPPRLWDHLSEMFNRSSAPYLICYHSPFDIIESYGFNVKLVVQAPTSMHGSSEGHMGYIYKRTGKNRTSSGPLLCDPLFETAWEAVKGGIDVLEDVVECTIQDSCSSGRLTRSRGVKMTAISSIEEKEEAEKNGKM